MIQRWFFGKGKQPESAEGQGVPPPAVEEALIALQGTSEDAEESGDDASYRMVSEELALATGETKGKITFSVEDLGDKEITAVNARAVENLEHSVKREAIRIAKDILENLKIKCAGMLIKELIDSGDIPLMDEVLEGMVKVTGIFDHHLKIALRLDPALVKEEEMEEAIAALGIFQYHTTLKAADQAMIKAVMAEQKGEREHAANLRAQATAMRADIAAMPPEYKNGASAKVGDLLAKVEKGMDRVVERMQQMTQSMMGDAATISRDKMGGNGHERDSEPTQNAQQAWGAAQASQQNAAQQQAQQQIALNAAKAIQEARAARQNARNATRQQTNAKATLAPPRAHSHDSPSSQQGNPSQQAGPPPVSGMMGGNAGNDPTATASAIRRNSIRSTTAGVTTNKVRVTAPKITPPVVAHPPTPHPPAFGGMLDPSMLSSMQGRMASVAGQKTSDALAPNSAARTIATLKQEQEQQRASASSAKTAEKVKQSQTAHEHEEHEKAVARKAEEEKAHAGQSPVGQNPRKPTITR